MLFAKCGRDILLELSFVESPIVGFAEILVTRCSESICIITKIGSSVLFNQQILALWRRIFMRSDFGAAKNQQERKSRESPRESAKMLNFFIE